MTKAKAKPKTKAKPKATPTKKMTAKAKAKAKAKAAKKTTVKLTPDELYESFMKCVQEAEDAKTATARNKLIKTAMSHHKKLARVEDELSDAQAKRVGRTLAFLKELKAGK